MLCVCVRAKLFNLKSFGKVTEDRLRVGGEVRRRREWRYLGRVRREEGEKD